jgi:AcrR family transcriptional regulator
LARSRWISDLHWVRPGQQSRSQRTQQSLLDAAEALVAEKGADATSVADVAARAGCSVGAVYHHFRDKKALLYALFDRMSEQLRATTREAVDPARWEGASTADILQGYLEFSLEMGRERPAAKRAGLEASRSDPALRERYRELRSELCEELTGLLLARRDEVGHPDPVLALGFVLDQLASMLQTRLDEMLLPTRLANRSDEEFVREALRSACAYLQVEPPVDRGD